MCVCVNAKSHSILPYPNLKLTFFYYFRNVVTQTFSKACCLLQHQVLECSISQQYFFCLLITFFFFPHNAKLLKRKNKVCVCVALSDRGWRWGLHVKKRMRVKVTAQRLTGCYSPREQRQSTCQPLCTSPVSVLLIWPFVERSLG